MTAHFEDAAADLRRQVAALERELQTVAAEREQALAQQAAIAEILKVIASSPSDVQPVFEAIATSANRLLRGHSTTVTRYMDGKSHIAAFTPVSPEADAALVASYPRPLEGNAAYEAVRDGGTFKLPDVEAADPDGMRDQARLRGWRSVTAVPLSNRGAVIGSIAVTRAMPGALADDDIQLLQTFADQAVIAIQNARMFEEVQARTRDLTEALQQQTATADVLKAISRTAFDLDTVLEALISTAVRLCDAKYGEIFRRRGDVYRFAASLKNAVPEYVDHEEAAEIRPGRGTLVGRVALEKRAVQIADAWSDPEYAEKDEARMGDVRSMLGVPLMRDGEPIGAFALARSEPIPFTRRQVELVTTFADQAVIAIENVRLFDEVQARTGDLTEALQQQTATAEVLKVISRSAFDLQVVLDTLVSSASQLCGVTSGLIFLKRGDALHLCSAVNTQADPIIEELRRNPQRAGRGSIASRVLLTGQVQNVPDVQQDPEYDSTLKGAIQVRALLGVPLKRDGEIVGAFVLRRTEPGIFDVRHVELVETFADQAVIAIENVRLFDEVQARTRDLTEALQLQTATSDVLKVISRSAFDLQAVFDALIAFAVELCDAFSGSICVRDGDVFRYTGSAGLGAIPALHDYLTKHPATPGRGTMVGRVLLSGKVEHIRDRLEDEEYSVPTAAFGNMSRAFLGVPLLGKAGIEGALVLTREAPGYFSDRQIEIVQTFADQAVIAIENVRLFEQVQARTKELTASLDDLRKAQDRLIQSEKLASLGQLTAGIAHEIKNPLNFVNNFAALSRELLDELRETLDKANLQKAVAEETQDLIEMVASNLDKVVSHGKRADSIVKNMLLHSREGSGERTSVNINAMVEEALNLAYHGARAEKAGFNVTIAKSLDRQAGSAEIFAQEMTRVLLNLISNGFYATTKRKQAQVEGTYEPTITASTRDLGHIVEIAIRDNGTGIPDEVKAKMFNPFFTTKPAGEGTGLGLSLSHDIVVKQHGGTMEVSTEPGATQFSIRVPRTAPASDGAAA